MSCYARFRTKDSQFQNLDEHLLHTARLASIFGSTYGWNRFEEIAGLLHDIGKATFSWQKYLLNSIKGKRETKIDHATAGAQLLEYYIGSSSVLAKTAIQATIMFHHGSGLPDMISPDGSSEFFKRLNKRDVDSSLSDIKENLGKTILSKINELVTNNVFVANERSCFLDVCKKGSSSQKQLFFNMGMHLRNFSSCLIDADRTDSAAFDLNDKISLYSENRHWSSLILRLENKLKQFSNDDTLGKIRTYVSERCREIGQKEKGVYTCSAFTGSGKTLASLRFALEQAQKHSMKHIFIIAPYTSIIDQNAEVLRAVLEDENSKGRIVLECHSNLTEEKKTSIYDSERDYGKYEANWNAPVIITTMVQFLETLFGSGTKKIRRMHTLANSVLVFDEIQTLPIKATYLFNWALEYLVNCCGSSALLCTATQPCLDKIDDEKYHFKVNEEIIENVDTHFSSLKRVEFVDMTDGGIKKVSAQEVCKYIQEQMQECTSFLAVVNTKPQAKELFELVKQSACADFVYHLSTNMCPAHRKKIIGEIRLHLSEGDRIVCISTRLIEAGVDLSFDGALRYMAGLDSVIQTAGRCNRNNELTDEKGKKICGKVAIFSVEEEKLGTLEELKIGQRCMERVLRDFPSNKETGAINLIQPEIIARFFTYYYSEFSEAMLEYSVKNKDSTVLDMLSDNPKAVAEYGRIHNGEKWKLPYMQSFKTAWENFEVIADATTGIIVPYKNDIAGRLCALERGEENYGEKLRLLLHEAQQYSVNVYSNQLERLMKEKMIYEVLTDTGSYALFDDFYDENLGLVYDSAGESIDVLSF